MKHSQSKRSISKSSRCLSSNPIKQKINSRNSSQSQVYFCHFNNAMYMGGIKSFQKHGRGLLIHDNGTSVITSYMNDFKHGHNIYYKNDCILSIEFSKNKIRECVLRIQNYLLFLQFNNENKPHGKAILVVYETRSIYYILYRKGVISQKKQETDEQIIHRIFQLNNIEILIGDYHAGAVKFDIEKDRNIACQIIDNKYYVGFYKKGFMNGLGFVLMIKNNDKENECGGYCQETDNFYLKQIERGYFSNSKLSGMGEKWFKNGNLYKGDFKNGVFQGSGILKNELKNNWVFGTFECGNLHQLLDFSHEGDIHKLGKLMVLMHERKNNWIRNDLQSQSHDDFIKQIDKILQVNPTQQMKNLKFRKQEVLRKIQDNFVADLPKDYQKWNKSQVINDKEQQRSQVENKENQYQQSTYSKKNITKNIKKDSQTLQKETHFSTEKPEKNPKCILKINQRAQDEIKQKKHHNVDIRDALVKRMKELDSRQSQKSRKSQKPMIKRSKQVQLNVSALKWNQKKYLGQNYLLKTFDLEQYDEIPKFHYTGEINNNLSN